METGRQGMVGVSPSSTLLVPPRPHPGNRGGPLGLATPGICKGQSNAFASQVSLHSPSGGFRLREEATSGWAGG